MSVWTTLRFAFSPTGTIFLVVNDEGRFRLFDTGMLCISLHSFIGILDRSQSLVLVFAGAGKLQVEFAAQAVQADNKQCTCFDWALVGQKVRPETYELQPQKLSCPRHLCAI